MGRVQSRYAWKARNPCLRGQDCERHSNCLALQTYDPLSTAIDCVLCVSGQASESNIVNLCITFRKHTADSMLGYRVCVCVQESERCR